MKKIFEIGLLVMTMLVIAAEVFAKDTNSLSEASGNTYIRFFNATPSKIRKGETTTLWWGITDNPRVIIIMRNRELPGLGSFEKVG